MDQEQPKRRRNARKQPENGAETGKEGQNTADSASQVPNGGSEGDEMQGVRESPPVAPFYDPRAAIAEALSGILTPTQVTYLLQEVLAINKRVRFTLHCDKCGHANQRNADIPDAKAVVSALTDLLAQGFGRPGEAKLDSANITFVRITNLADFEEEQAT